MEFSSLLSDEAIDAILREAADGYGDLMAASLVHNLSIESLQTRAGQLSDLKAAWISW